MEIINRNIKFLRKQKNYTQQAFADALGIKRPSIGAYEEGRAKPNLSVQKIIATLFDISLDSLLTKDLAHISENNLPDSELPKKDIIGKGLRVLSITVDEEDRENIELVGEKASAGYLNGYADPEYIQALPRFQLPFLPLGTYRAFEIKGDSMLPLQSGSIVISEYISDWHDIKDGNTYVVVSREEGVVYKRVFNTIAENGKLTLQSDNPSYSPFTIPIDDVMEVWQAKLFISKAVPDKDISMDKMMGILSELQNEIKQLKEIKH